MPLYDFRCSACQTVSELLVKPSDAPVCPQCGGSSLEKLIALPAAPGRSKSLLASARAQAAKEGHFSNYTAAERSRMKT